MHFGPAPTFAFALGVATSLFSIINPPSSSIVFAGATTGMERKEVRSCARKASLTAGIAMLVCALLGQFLPFQLITLGGGLAATISVYGLAAKAMGIEELHIVLALLRSRRRPVPDSSGP